MRGTLWTIAAVLLAVWLLSFVVGALVHLIGWLIHIAPLIVLVLIIAGFLAQRKSAI